MKIRPLLDISIHKKLIFSTTLTDSAYPHICPQFHRQNSNEKETLAIVIAAHQWAKHNHLPFRELRYANLHEQCSSRNCTLMSCLRSLF